MSTALQTEPEPGRKGPERPSRALCHYQPGYENTNENVLKLVIKYNKFTLSIV